MNLLTELLEGLTGQTEADEAPELEPTDAPKGIDNRSTPLDFADVEHQADPAGTAGLEVATITDVDFDRLARAYRRLGSQLAEVLELRRHPQPVWVRPSGRITTPAGDLGTSPTTIIPEQLDRLRVTIMNAAAEGGPTIYLVNDEQKAGTIAAGLYGFALAAGAAVTIDTTAAIAAVCPGGGGQWSAIVETIGLGR